VSAIARTSIFFAIFLFLFTGCWGENSKLLHPSPLKQDPFIQVYFNHDRSKGKQYREPYRKIRRYGDNFESIIIDALDSAKSSIDVAVQELNLPNIAQKLVERDRADIKVRVILENTYNRSLSEFNSVEINNLKERDRDRYREFQSLVDINKDGRLSPSEIDTRDALKILQNAGIPIIDDTADGSRGSGLMHHKYIIIDDRVVITGSANFTLSDFFGDFTNPESRGNANNLLAIDNFQLANLFTEEFNLMWGDGKGGQLDSKFGLQKISRDPQQIIVGNSVIEVHFSPTSTTIPWYLSSNGLIARTLGIAQKEINLALFVFSDQNLANLLEAKNQDRVAIKALIDPSFAFRYYSEALDMLGVTLNNKCKTEVNNHPWQIPIQTVGVPELFPGDKLHHKFALIDDKIVITGSHNWSEAANSQNDETALVIYSSKIAAHFSREFKRIYENAKLGLPTNFAKKQKMKQQQCSSL
jgi:phosphatidylserine/phosphatidylglycerophosphate/cardiolipin synthase-like enzyme